MNYFASAKDGDFGSGFSLIHPDSHHADAVVVPDAELLFTGNFHRSGSDLVLTGHDGRHHVVAGYFASEHPPALVAPNGAHLSPHIVESLAGSPAPGEYAQAQTQTQTAAPPDSIGKVQKVVGTVTVLHNGVSVTLNVGDVVYKTDIVVTGADSKCGITFPDGTALELLPDTRMALTEYSYDPNGNSNSALFTYVTGTFGFFAGKVAHTGDMKIETPVATMGIRGTTGVMGQGKDASGNDIFWQVIYDDPGTNISGSWDDFLRNPDGTLYVGATISQTDFMTIFTLRPGQPPLVTTVPITDSYNDIGREIIAELTELLNLGVNPHSIGGHPGSGDNPLLTFPPNFQPEYFGNFGPYTYNYNYQPPTPPTLPPPQIPPPFIPTPPGTTPVVFIWPKGNNPWDSGPNWLPGFSPVQTSDSAIIESGIVTYPSGDNYIILSLTIDGPGTLDMVGGTLTVTNDLDVAGLLLVEGDPPTFSASGLITVESGGKIESVGDGALVELFGTSASDPATVENFGTITAKHGGNVTFLDALVTNEAANAGNTDPDTTTRPGRIISIGHDSIDDDSIVDFDHSDLDNAGIVAAKHYGEIFFADSSVTNEATGHIRAKHHGIIEFAGTNVTNFGAILAEFAGKITFDSLSQVTNETGGRIESSGCESCIAFSGNEVDNSGVIGAACYGTVTFTGETIVNEAANTGGAPTVPGGKIEASYDGLIKIDQGGVTNDNGAVIDAKFGGEVDFHNTFLLNDAGSKVTAEDCGLILFAGPTGSLTNLGTIEAKNHGEVKFDGIDGVMNEDGGEIGAKDHGTVVFERVSVTNDDGTSTGLTDGSGGLIEAIGCGSKVELADSTIIGGTIETRNGGLIETVWGDSTFINVTLDGAVVQVDCHTSLALSGGSSGIAATIDGKVTLEGPGVVTMAYQSYEIVSGTPHATLYNDTKIVGAGTIGNGNPSLTLVNNGVITALYLGKNHGDFVIDTGVGAHGAATTINDGLITAFGDKAVMEIENTSLDNDCRGSITAVDDGTVKIDASTVTDGTIAAVDHGTVDLDDATVIGSTLDTFHHGVIETVTEHGNPTTTTFDDVTNKGYVLVQADTTLALEGTIDNDGTIVVDSESHSSAGADLEIDGTVKLDGCGDVVLDGRNDEITGAPTDAPHGAKLENFSEISGYGKIGSDGDGRLTLDNKADGVVDADVSHEKLFIETGNTVVNAGLLEATRRGILDIEDAVNNKGGEIDAQRFSTVIVDGVTIDNTDHGANDGYVEANGCGATVVLYGDTEIIGGTLSTSDGGLIEIANKPGQTHSDVVFDGAETAASGTILPLTIDGLVRVDENTALTLEGTIHNKGTIDVDGAAGADLIIQGTVKLGGGGDIALDGPNDEITGASVEESDLNRLDNIDNTISGAGKIVGTEDKPLVLNNESNGVIDADMRHEKLVIETGNTVTNEGLLEANCGGVLDIKDDINNKGGTIGAYGAGSLVKLFGITVTGGTIETGDPYWRDDGVIEVVATSVMTVFDGSQKHNPVTVAGFVQVDPGAQLELKGTIDLDGGAIELDQATHHEAVVGANLVIDGTVTLNGFGDVALEGDGTGIVGAWCDGGTLINNSYIYGSRGGFIGTGDDSLTFINNNIVDSEAGQAGPLVIDTGCNSVTNTGTLEATGASELDLYGTYANKNGTIAAAEDGSGPSVVKLFGATIHGGTLVTDGGDVAADGSTIEIVAGYGMTIFDGSGQKVIVDAYVNVDSDAQLELIGTIKDVGIINIDEAACGADLVIDGTVKLNGGGEVLLSGAADDIIGAGGDDDADNTLVNSDTIAGYGHIGNAGSDESTDLTLTNKGTVDADVTGQTLTIHTGHTVDNQGTLEASSGGTLQIDDNVADNNVISAADNGTVILNGDTVSGGEISIDASSTLKIENGTTILSNVDVENSGNLVIDSGSIVALLEVEAGSTIHGGTITVDGAGEFDVLGGTFDGVTVDDKGIFNIDGPLTIAGDIAIDLDGGVFTDSGILTVASGTSATISGVSVGTVDIEKDATFTLDDADAATVDFAGRGGTLQIDSANDIPGTIADFAKGDVIDLTNLAFSKSATAIWDSGSNTLTISNGTQTESLHLSGTYSQTEFALQKDGSGTDLVIINPTLTGQQSETVDEYNSVASLGVTDSAAHSDVTITGLPSDLINFDGGTYTAGSGTWTGTQAEFNALSFTAGAAGTYDLLIVANTTGTPETTTDTFTLTVDPLVPEIAPQTEAQTIPFNAETPVTGISVSEADSTVGEIFTVTLTDSTGLLSTGGSEGTITDDGSNDLIISGTLNQVNDDLGSLTDTNATPGTDNITVAASDGFGNSAAAQTYDVTVTVPPPVITSAGALGIVTENYSLTAPQNLILNGGFEQYTYNSQTNTYTIPDWTFGGLFYYPPGEASPPHTGTGDLAVYTYTLGIGTASQSFATDVGQDYDVTFYLYRAQGTANSFSAIWDGTTEVSLQNYTNFGSYVEYQFNAVATESTSTLQFNFYTGTVGYWFLDDVSVAPIVTGGTENRAGTITFTDPDASSTHTPDVTPEANGYLGTFTANVTHDSTGGVTGDVAWNFTVSDSALKSLAAGQVVTQTYDVTIAGSNGAEVEQPVTIELVGINSQAPTGFTFTPDTADLNFLENSSSLESFTGIGTFTETGGIAGDTFTFSLGGAGASAFSDSPGTTADGLYTGTSNVAGSANGKVYALTLTITDPGNAESSGPLPFDVVVGNSSANTINLETGTNNLGIAPTTPTIVYGLSGNDTINATGMTASVWFVGGAGADTMTGGSGQNTYLYSAVSESQQGSGADTITNFQTTDSIDFAGLSGINAVQGLLASTSTNIAGHSIAWIQSGTKTLVYANTSSSSHSQTGSSSSVVEIILNNFTATNLAGGNFILSNGSVGPAGVAGAPINLALADHGSETSLTITGLPGGWSLNQGAQNSDGTWTVQTNDPTSLAVMTAAGFAGAALLHVAETWTNADGSAGLASVADNVEAYAPGSPIFALAGDDTLTGAGANDTYVFAQPIGNDTVYNFNAATDKIDLVGFANIASFGDLQSHIAQDANGDAVVTIADGETITLNGVNAASLTANDFAFNQTPTVENTGTLTIGDGAVLPLGGTIENTGTIALNSTGDQTELQIVGNGLTLDGGGHVTLSGDALIAGTDSADTLTNVDNTISGSGHIGTGDGSLALVNETHGTIDADVAGAPLVLGTGTAINNAGVLEATGGGVLQVADSVNNTGIFEANGGTIQFEGSVNNSGAGHAVVAGGTLEFDAASNVNVAFDNGQNGTTYGELVLNDAPQFTGDISGFTGTAPDQAHSDSIDLGDINYNSAAFAESYNATTDVLTVSDGTTTASLTFVDFNGSFKFASDGNGGTDIFDPPAANSAAAVTIGGPGNDNFKFAPGMGSETMTNFNPQHDTIEFDHFSNAQTVQELQSLITSDAHGDAFINLGNHDSVTVEGLTAAQLQAHLQTLVHLH